MARFYMTITDPRVDDWDNAFDHAFEDDTPTHDDYYVDEEYLFTEQD